MVTRWQPLVPSTREEQKGQEMGEPKKFWGSIEKSQIQPKFSICSLLRATLLTLVGSSHFHQCKSKNRSIPQQIIHLPSSTQSPVKMSGRRPGHLQVESRAARGGWTARLPLPNLRESPMRSDEVMFQSGSGQYIAWSFSKNLNGKQKKKNKYFFLCASIPIKDSWETNYRQNELATYFSAQLNGRVGKFV